MMSAFEPFFVCRVSTVPYAAGRLNVARATYEQARNLEPGRVTTEGDVTSVIYPSADVVLYVPEAS